MNKTLDVLICTIHQEGIERVASALHPEIDGVRYLVAWQMPEGEGVVPASLADRKDFVIQQFQERGLARNRNRCLAMAEADWCIISDDDLDYTESELQQLLSLLKQRSDLEIVAVRYNSGTTKHKIYPAEECDYADAIAGYYISSVEIIFKREIIQNRIRFNENFGIGAPIFKCGEEDIFIHDCRKACLSVRFVPITVGTHPHLTTSLKDADKDYVYLTKGAVYRYIYPSIWWLRLFVYGIRGCLKGNLRIGLYRFLKLTFRGASILKSTSFSL
jgi:glycosyltransferase involved in cell wall biosynthesis